MLQRQHRLSAEKDFQTTWKRGRSFYTKILGFKISRNDLAVSRFGVVVGNKVSKKSTDRNRLKRQLREILQAKIGKIRPGYDLVVTALPAALGEKYQSLEKELVTGLKYFKIVKT